MAEGTIGARGLWKVITASSVGTLIEWYDFYIFGSLATTLAPAFFPKTNPTVALLSTLATFATGFIVRPFGALFFGRIGDMVGRKYAFLVTLLLMGGSTFAIGLLPTYAQVGALAPILLLILRLLQGLALGGEYGGAATYVAEHSPKERRGYYTSFIQTTATLGLAVSLGVILLTSSSLSKEEFESWGWRIPFLLSLILVIFSYAIRRRMSESPLFEKLKSENKVSTNPLKESFGNPANRRLVLLALFGATAGQGVVWYTGQFYALYYMQTVLNIAKASASYIIAITLLIGTPLFIYFGALSDRIGRKKIIVTGCLLAALCYVPIYSGMVETVRAATLRPLQRPFFDSHQDTDPKTGKRTQVFIFEADYADASVSKSTVEHLDDPSIKPESKTEIRPSPSLMVRLGCFILIQVVFVTMVYGPIAAFLVELFPTRIRYSSMSLPYHIGNGVFGGLVPFIATALEKGTGNLYAGLAYPITVALVTAFIGGFFIREKPNIDLSE